MTLIKIFILSWMLCIWLVSIWYVYLHLLNIFYNVNIQIFFNSLYILLILSKTHKSLVDFLFTLVYSFMGVLFFITCSPVERSVYVLTLWQCGSGRSQDLPQRRTLVPFGYLRGTSRAIFGLKMRFLGFHFFVLLLVYLA